MQLPCPVLLPRRSILHLAILIGLVTPLLPVSIYADAVQAAPVPQTQPTPDVVTVWQGTGGRGYELYRAGALPGFSLTSFTLWDTAPFGSSQCPPGQGEMNDDGASIRVKAWAEAASNTVEAQNCDALVDSIHANVVRNQQTLYYFVDGRLSRKATYAGPDTTATQLVNAPPLADGGSEAVALDSAGRLLWADHVDESQFDDLPGDNFFYRMPADDNAPAELLFRHPNVREVVKLKTMRYSANGPILQTFVWLTADGELYRYQPVSEGDWVVKLADDVLDFAVHAYETESAAPRALILAVRGRTPANQSSPEGELLQIDPLTLASTKLWPDKLNNDRNQLVSVAVDSGALAMEKRNVYITEEPYTCTAINCSKLPGQRIYRRQLFVNGASGNCISQFCLMLEGEDGGDLLASDDQWLYFRRSSFLYRYPTDAPPIARDLKATWLEVNQAIQNLDNQFPLVADHETVARGYAEIELDSTGDFSYQITARLTGVLDGQPLPETLLPVQNVTVEPDVGLSEQRRTAELTFFFRLPEHWVRNKHGDIFGAADPSQLQLEMVINPNAAVVETTYVNNSVTATVDVVQRETTCLVSMPLLTKAPVPNMWQLPLALIGRNTQKYLPVSGIKFYNYHTTWLSTENFESSPFLLSDGGEPFVMSDRTDGGARDVLEMIAAISTPPCPGSTHWLGVIHSKTNTAGVGGWGRSPGQVLLAKLSYLGEGSKTLAHELMHNFGREHTKCGDFPENEANFDYAGLGQGALLGLPIEYDPCTLGPSPVSNPANYVGLDVVSLAVKNPADFADIMSYSDDQEWVSTLNWYYLLNNSRLLPPVASVSAADLASEEVLLVQGALGPAEDQGELRTVLRLPTGAVPAEQVQAATLQAAAQDDGAYEIRLLDGAGSILQSANVMTEHGVSHTDGADPLTFIQYVPFPEATVRVQLIAHGAVVADRAASATAPLVTLTEFDVDEVSERVDLSWSGSDGDGDALVATVLYSADDGATWRALGHGLPGSDSVRLGTQNLSAGQQARLRVVVNDGVHTGMATSAAFTVPEHPPVPAIDGLVDGERLPYGINRTVNGFALDPEEGTLDSNRLAWRLDGPTTRSGTGAAFALTNLLPGTYTLTLRATDRSGLSGESTLGFELLPLVVPDGDTPSLDGLCTDSSYAAAARIQLPRNRMTVDELRWPEAYLLHADGALYICFTGQAYGTGQESRLVGLQVDADGAGGTGPASDDIGFFVDEDGIATRTSSLFGSMAPNPLPIDGFDVAIYPTATFWSAEFRIVDALVGGWDHAARLLIKHQVDELTANELNWPPAGEHSVPNTWAVAYFGTPPAPANRPPVAVAGHDIQTEIRGATTLYLDGSLSYDPDNDRLRYRWRQVSGPAVTLVDANSSMASVAVEPVREAVDLRFQLIVGDAQAESPPDEIVWRLLPGAVSIPGPYDDRTVFLPIILGR